MYISYLPLPKTEPCNICHGLDNGFPMKVRPFRLSRIPEEEGSHARFERELDSVLRWSIQDSYPTSIEI